LDTHSSEVNVKDKTPLVVTKNAASLEAFVDMFDYVEAKPLLYDGKDVASAAAFAKDDAKMGMKAWHVTLVHGRVEFVVIGNEAGCAAGSFGVATSRYFAALLSYCQTNDSHVYTSRHLLEPA
jgi:hypothetical protein